MSHYVIYSSVILAILKQEPGAEAAIYLGNGFISTVNMTEVLTKLLQLGYSQEDTQNIAKMLPVSLVSFSEEFVFISASLHEQTKALGLSFGDRACLTLGIQKNLPVLTADRIWRRLDLPINIKLIR